MKQHVDVQILNADGYRRLIKKLLPPQDKDRGSHEEMQKMFLDLAAQSSVDAMPAWLEEKCGIEGARQKLSIPEHPLSEDQVSSPPLNVEAKYWNLWQEVDPQNAASSSWWASLHLALIRNGRIETSWLAAREQPVQTGVQRIDRALQADTKTVTGCIRDILRHLGGIPRDRGRRTAYLDCRMSRGWWRRRFAEEAVSRFPGSGSVESAHTVLRNSGLWERLCEYMVSRLTAVGEEKLRAAVILFLSEEYTRSGWEALVLKKEAFTVLLQSLGRRTVWQAVGMLSVEELLEIIKREAGT